MTSRNDLIEHLSSADRDAVLAECISVDFSLGHCFAEPGDRPVHIHFVDTGVVSAMAIMEDGRTVESFMVGNEGMTATLAGKGARRVQGRLVGQIAGSARRIETAKLVSLAEDRAGLREAVADYTDRLIGELEQSTACNALHNAEARFAKWLLRCHDRAGTSTLILTQEFLASMLGSQRTTVNAAAQDLQRQGAIRYLRGKVQIVDRAKLERSACECYGKSRLRRHAVNEATV